MVDGDTVDEPATKDGFRKPRRRGKGWLEKAIKDGSVRDPNAPPPEDIQHTGHVIDVPIATVESTGKEE